MKEVTVDTRIYKESELKIRLYAIKTEDGTFYNGLKRVWTRDINAALLWKKESSAVLFSQKIIAPPEHSCILRRNEKKYTKLYVVEVQVVELGEFEK